MKTKKKTKKKSSKKTIKSKFKVGDRVELNTPGGYYKQNVQGTVLAVNKDGTASLKLDSGLFIASEHTDILKYAEAKVASKKEIVKDIKSAPLLFNEWDKTVPLSYLFPRKIKA